MLTLVYIYEYPMINFVIHVYAGRIWSLIILFSNWERQTVKPMKFCRNLFLVLIGGSI